MIQSLGGDSFSNSETSRFLGPLLRWLFPEAGTELLGQAQFAIRKAAHVVEYGILALLCIRAWRLSYGWSQSNSALASMAVVVAVAAVDESRQAQAADRAGAASDVLLDTIGGVSALLGRRFATRWLPR
ncbi:MAG: VanZ family protein [Myxococcota bacterium]